MPPFRAAFFLRHRSQADADLSGAQDGLRAILVYNDKVSGVGQADAESRILACGRGHRDAAAQAVHAAAVGVQKAAGLPGQQLVVPRLEGVQDRRGELG